MRLYNQSLNENVDNIQVNNKLDNSGGSKRKVDVLLPLLVTGYRGTHSIEGNKVIEDYDVIHLIVGNEIDYTNGYTPCFNFTKGQLANSHDNSVSFSDWGQRVCRYTFSGNNVVFVENQAEQEARNPYIMYMEGVKYE